MEEQGRSNASSRAGLSVSSTHRDNGDRCHVYVTYISYLHMYNYMYTHRYQQELDIVGHPKGWLSSSTPGPLPYTNDQEKWAECQELLARGECV